MSLPFDNRIGAEDLQLAVYKTILANIDSYITAEETRGITLDNAIATAGNLDPNPTSLEPFNHQNIHYGHRPSMIEAPIMEYPSMAINTFLATPANANSTADYGHSIGLRIAVEVIVKDGPYPQDDRTFVGEVRVGKRVKRTAEAIHRLLQDHQALDGTFLPPETPPTVSWGEIYEREEDGDTALGARWYWQGVRLEYTYLKQTVFGLD